MLVCNGFWFDKLIKEAHLHSEAFSIFWWKLMCYIYKHVLYIDTWSLSVSFSGEKHRRNTLGMRVWTLRGRCLKKSSKIPGDNRFSKRIKGSNIDKPSVRDELRNWNKKWINQDMFYRDILFQWSFFCKPSGNRLFTCTNDIHVFLQIELFSLLDGLVRWVQVIRKRRQSNFVFTNYIFPIALRFLKRFGIFFNKIIIMH